MDDAEGRVTVALLADTHGHLDARIAELVADCDIAVHAGDVGGGAVLDALAPRGGRVLAVRGNNDTPDRWPDDARRGPRDLPAEASLALPGGRLVVTHGDRHPAARRHARLRRAYPDAAAVVYGHSHRLADDRDSLPWILNPGAAGRTRTYGGPSCLILTAAPDGWRVDAHRFAPPARRKRSA